LISWHGTIKVFMEHLQTFNGISISDHQQISLCRKKCEHHLLEIKLPNPTKEHELDALAS